MQKTNSTGNATEHTLKISNANYFLETEDSKTLNCNRESIKSITIDCSGWQAGREYAIKDSMFKDFSLLEKVEFKDSAHIKFAKIGKEAFKKCKKLREICSDSDMSNCLRLYEIGNKAFFGCKELQSFPNVDLYRDIKIGDQAFCDCLALRNVRINGRVDTKIKIDIGKEAFSRCGKLESVGLSNAKITVGAGAFKECKNLINFNLTNSFITSNISVEAFHSCEQLKEFTCALQEETEKNEVCIGFKAFASCDKLEKVHVTVINNEQSGRHTVKVGKKAFQPKFTEQGSSLCEFALIIECASTDIEIVTFNESCFYNCVKLTDIKIDLKCQPQDCNFVFERFSLHGCQSAEICGQKFGVIFSDADKTAEDIYQYNNYIFSNNVFENQTGEE